MNSAAVTELKTGPGFVVGPEPSEAEVDWLRNFVQRKWRRVLSDKYPALCDMIATTPITAYHNIAHLIDHGSTWGKTARLFNSFEVRELTEQLSVFQFLSDAFGPYEVADIEGLGHPEIYWRLVRPNQP